MLFLTLFFVPAVLSLFEDNPHIRDLTFEEIKKEIENPDYLVVSIIYDPVGKKSWQVSRTLLDLTDKFNNFIQFVAFDCSSDPAVCPPENLPMMPSVQAFVPAGLNPYTGKPLVYERQFQGNVLGKELGEFFHTNVPYLGSYLESATLEEFLSENSTKTILFTNKDTVPIIYKGITSKFRGKIDFGIVWSNQTDLISKYDIQEYPSLLILHQNSTIKYQGKYDFKDISNYLKKYAATERKPLKLKKIPETENKQEIKLPEFEIFELKPSNYEENVKSYSGVILVHFYKDKKLPEWEEISKDYNGIVKLGTINCKKENFEFCQSLGAKKFPSVRLFPVHKGRKSYELSIDNKNNIEEELSRELRYDIQVIQEAAAETFTSTITSEKVVCAYIGQGPIPIHLKGLASDLKFKDFVKFVYINIPEEKVSKYFHVERYPTLLGVLKRNNQEELQSIKYQGSLTDYQFLYYFVDQVAIPIFLEKQPSIPEEDQEDLDEAHDSSDLNSKCLKKSGICVINFVENLKSFKESSQYSVIKNVKAVMDSRKLPLNFILLNGICQYELRDAFGILEGNLPTLAIFSPSKGIGSRLIGKFISEDIFQFIEGILRGKAETFDVSDLKFVDRDCQAISLSSDNVQDADVDTVPKKKKHKKIHRKQEIDL
jgi:hypothetical protein